MYGIQHSDASSNELGVRSMCLEWICLVIYLFCILSVQNSILGKKSVRTLS